MRMSGGKRGAVRSVGGHDLHLYIHKNGNQGGSRPPTGGPTWDDSDRLNAPPTNKYLNPAPVTSDKIHGTASSGSKASPQTYSWHSEEPLFTVKTRAPLCVLNFRFKTEQKVKVRGNKYDRAKMACC